MNSLSLDQPRYLRAAFTHQYNLILLGGALLFSLAFASWIPLAVGIALEVVWLVAGPRIDRFRRSIDHDVVHSAVMRNSVILQQGAESLHPGYGSRIGQLESEAQEIHTLVASWPGSAEQKREVTARLEPLLRLFLDLAGSYERLRRFVASTRRVDLESEVQTLTHSLANETDFEVRVSMRRALSLAERRIKQLDSIETTGRALEMRMQTIEKSFSYIKSCAVSMTSWDQLYAEIDGITSQLRTSSSSEAETDDLMAAASSMHEHH
jgi:hypothetical protein